MSRFFALGAIILLAETTVAQLPPYGISRQSMPIIIEPGVLPSMNFWDLSSLLLRDTKLQADLDVSPRQIRAIRSLRSGNSDLARRIDAKSKDIVRQALINSESYSSLEIQYLALRELDPLVKLELAKILRAEQVDSMRLNAMRNKYGDGYSAFNSREVRQHCGFTDADLLSVIRKEKDAADDLVAKAERQSIERFIADLPEEAKLKYAYYVGPRNVPNIKISHDKREELYYGESPPYPGHNGALQSMATDAAIQESLEITDFQLAAIKTLWKNYQQEISEVLATPKVESTEVAERYHAMNSKYRQLCDNEVLTRSQILAIDRQFAYTEYVRNPSKALSRPEFGAYLGLTEEQLQAASAMALREHQLLQSQNASIRKASFTSISKELEPAVRERLLELFEGVFE